MVPALLATATLISVVLGKNPEAVVHEGGAVRVVHVGGIIDGRHVRSISLSGVVLSHGRRLILVSRGRQPHPPHALATARTQRATTVVTGAAPVIPCTSVFPSQPVSGEKLGAPSVPVPVPSAPCR